MAMGLVDYSSSSSDGDEDVEDSPASKRRKLADGPDGPDGPDGESRAQLPPLPAAFHDLYASTVRQSVVDDPSLHQGRKRLNPHVVGNWPSHVYVEWHPSKSQHHVLESLVRKTRQLVGHGIHLHSLLTSDLGTELPLHISLSKPLSLAGSLKDGFFARLEESVRRSGVAPFSVRPAGLAWCKSPDSDRTFFVLRVVTASDASPGGGGDMRQPSGPAANPELMALLARCNGVAACFQQPPLYQQTRSESADAAFHVSIGWTMGAPDEETCLGVLKKLGDDVGRDICSWRIGVDGVKVKIGNVVSHVSLSATRKGRIDGDGLDSLFGV
ncbi:uncharacterized protein UV8b_01454 [Ustilaginoidea virens]|uniref:U6 snRNA phosphodiesterase n=1 Tax=Ustilaginoidea virens TaxID=1159556 RepID=A0A8E5HKY7_USTVR|nr:uncharacterized protein UV8b_01454 [Ustilaginoidea virens]QUC17213.1 hypothetical protein UV8b_01454 [Ustilaginoidea virens]